MPEAVETGERRVTVGELDSGENTVIVRQWERKRCYDVGCVSERLESVFLVSKGVRAIGQGNARKRIVIGGECQAIAWGWETR